MRSLRMPDLFVMDLMHELNVFILFVNSVCVFKGACSRVHCHDALP